MTVLLWIAVLIGAWCVASVVTALALGTFLRRRHEATDPHGALRPLDTGPLPLWVTSVPDVLDEDALAELGVTTDLPAPRVAADRVTSDQVGPAGVEAAQR